jgi:hypothetical protein
MTPDIIWDNFTHDIANIVLSQRVAKNYAKKELEQLHQNEKILAEQGFSEEHRCSLHNMFFYDTRTDEPIFYRFKQLNTKELMTHVVLKKNREYQFLIMDAYEKFEDAIEALYAYLGKNDINFWTLQEYGNIKFNEISALEFSFYLSQSEKNKSGPIGIAKSLIDKFNVNATANELDLKSAIILVEKIRHIVVHKGGKVESKEAFIALLSKNCGIANNGKAYKTLCNRVDYYFGKGEYENTINLTEERIVVGGPLTAEACRFEQLLNSMLLCVHILLEETKKHISNLTLETASPSS